MGNVARIATCACLGLLFGCSNPADAGFEPEGDEQTSTSTTTDIEPGSSTGTTGSTGGSGAAEDSSSTGAPVVMFEVDAVGLGDGRLEPQGTIAVAAGESLAFEVLPRIDDCDVVVAGSCATTSPSEDALVIEDLSADCTLEVRIDCGPSTLELRPEHVGVLRGIDQQQFTATQVFERGKQRVDVTEQMQWSASEPTVANFESPGLAVVTADQGLIEVTATDPGAPQPREVATTLTVVTVDEWRNSPDCTEWSQDQVYLDDVVFDRTNPALEQTTFMTWAWDPRPWKPFDNSISGVVWFFWSYNDGATFTAQAWDYIGNDTTVKGLGAGSPATWMGTMVSTLCVPEACNGMDRSNIYFAEYPYRINPEL